MEKIIYYNERKVNSGNIWLLFLFLGWSYGSLGKMGKQIFFYLTLGGFGLWTFIRLFTLSGAIKEYNSQIAMEVGLTPDEMIRMGLTPPSYYTPKPEAKKSEAKEIVNEPVIEKIKEIVNEPVKSEAKEVVNEPVIEEIKEVETKKRKKETVQPIIINFNITGSEAESFTFADLYKIAAEVKAGRPWTAMAK